MVIGVRMVLSARALGLKQSGVGYIINQGAYRQIANLSVLPDCCLEERTEAIAR